MIMIWMILIVVRTAWLKYQLVREIRLTESQLKYLNKNNQQLEKSVKFLHNQDFLQREVKEKLNFKNPNEKMIIFK